MILYNVVGTQVKLFPSPQKDDASERVKNSFRKHRSAQWGEAVFIQVQYLSWFDV